LSVPAPGPAGDTNRNGADGHRPRYHIEERDGEPHGDVYELEIDHWFDVVDTDTGMTVLSLMGTSRAKLDDHGCWGPASYSGIESVELAPEGDAVLVRETGRPGERRMPIPDVP